MANASAPDCVGLPPVAGKYNLDSDGSCPFSAPNDLSGVDPLLGPLAWNGGPTHTHALLPGSPALDSGPLPGSGWLSRHRPARRHPTQGLRLRPRRLREGATHLRHRRRAGARPLAARVREAPPPKRASLSRSRLAWLPHVAGGPRDVRSGGRRVARRCRAKCGAVDRLRSRYPRVASAAVGRNASTIALQNWTTAPTLCGAVCPRRTTMRSSFGTISTRWPHAPWQEKMPRLPGVTQKWAGSACGCSRPSLRAGCAGRPTRRRAGRGARSARDRARCTGSGSSR